MSATSLKREAPRPERRKANARRKPALGTWAIFVLVAASQLAFGVWMNARGFLWFDALSRATSALTVLYSTDPHLAAVGFVWMPLPSFVEMLWVSVYPWWPSVVASGFASTFTTALAGGATAALLLAASRTFELPRTFGWAFALLVSFDPMLFLYASNGMSEGVAMPFLIGALATLTLFWRSGKRRYVLVSGCALALAFASLYQAVHYGAFLFAALVLGVLFSSGGERPDGKLRAPRGKLRALEGLGLLFLVPSFYVAALWVGANWTILGDPLYFAHSAYSNTETVAASSSGASVAGGLAGNLPGSLLFVASHTAPFLAPGLFLLLVRALDGRFFRVNTLSLVLLLCGVSFAFNLPVVYGGSSFGWLRYFMYPLFAAAGWGLYEVSVSPNRRRAMALVLAGWALAVPATLAAMTNNDYGRQENPEVRSIVSGERAGQTVFYNIIGEAPPIPGYLDKNVFPKGKVALDSFAGWPIAAQVSPEGFRNRLILSTNSDFRAVISKPKKHGVRYFLVPDPKKVPQDVILQKYPRMWSGEDPAFKRVKTFAASGQRQEWRLYEFVPPGSEEFRHRANELGRKTG